MPQSFRDPSGSVFLLRDRVFRVLNEAGNAELETFLQSKAATDLVTSGGVIATTRLRADDRSLPPEILTHVAGSPEVPFSIVEHERVWFPSFPYEWPAEMLAAAAALTLDVAQRLLTDNMGLKDATPYNILFRGPRPVFIDVLSIESRNPRDQIWLPYAQFLRTFYLPLLANRYFSLSLSRVFQTARDGVEPEEVYRLCGPLQRLIPPFLGAVSLPTWLGRRQNADPEALYKPRLTKSREQAEFVLSYVFKRLRKLIHRAVPGQRRGSVWSDYQESVERSDEFRAKQMLVESFMEEFAPKTVLDVGCNAGYLSALAAHAGARVVAIDSDPAVVAQTWRAAVREGLDILPLVVDFTRPSPAIGWRNAECPSFLDRARGRFDAVFMFAVIHHILVTERVPLNQLIDLTAELTTNMAVIEFIPTDDPLFRRITRGRDHLYAALTWQAFESAALRRFNIIRSYPVSGTQRQVYVLQLREVGTHD